MEPHSTFSTIVNHHCIRKLTQEMKSKTQFTSFSSLLGCTDKKWTQCKTMTQQYSLPTCTKLIWNIQGSEIQIVKNIIENTVTVYLDNDGEACSMTFTKPAILSPENKATQYICETEKFLRWVWKFLCKGMLRLLYSKRLHK